MIIIHIYIHTYIYIYIHNMFYLEKPNWKHICLPGKMAEFPLRAHLAPGCPAEFMMMRSGFKPLSFIFSRNLQSDTKEATCNSKDQLLPADFSFDQFCEWSKMLWFMAMVTMVTTVWFSIMKVDSRPFSDNNWLVVSTPLKNIKVSWDYILLFPIYGTIKFMFQTTNQMRWHIVTEGIRSIGLNIGSMIWGWQEKGNGPMLS